MDKYSDVSQQPIICLDGGAGVGKTTLGIKFAQLKDLRFIDSGSLYRLATYLAYENNFDFEDGISIGNKLRESKLDFGLDLSGKDPFPTLHLDGKDITHELFQQRIDAQVSIIGKIPEVRSAVVDKLKSLVGEIPTIVTGRDMGTVVFPESKLKMFVTVSQEIRAKRRLLQRSLDDSHYEEILNNIKMRDEIDSTRKIAPLKPADDAYIVKNDGKMDETLKEMIELYEKVFVK